MLRIFYLFLPLCLSAIPLFLFFENFTPEKIGYPFLKSLMIFFVLVILYLFSQLFLRKGYIETGIGLLFWLFLSFIILRERK